MVQFILGVLILTVGIAGLIYWIITRSWRSEPFCPILFMVATGLGLFLAGVAFISSPFLTLWWLVTF